MSLRYVFYVYILFYVFPGHGILELNILQAKDLVAMDSNGE